MQVTTLRIYAGEKPSGERVDEEVLVEDLGHGVWRLLASPGLALGIAAGDVIELDDDHRARPSRRGQNIAIQVFAPPHEGDELHEPLRALGGRLDGQTPSLTVYTVPAGAGFPAIEHVMDEFQAHHPSAEWFYGNVYDEDGTTPLRWWE